MDGNTDSLAEAIARVAQLEHALATRIVVEQAKGMLAERYGLTPTAAFELIRRAARSNNLRVRAVCLDVLAAKETPAPILEVLAREAPPPR